MLRAAVAMFGEQSSPTFLARSWLRFFKLPAERHDVFWRALIVASALHDLGKANCDFQDAVRRPMKQAIRHEHLTALLLGAEPLLGWLRTGLSSAEVLAVLSAVASHHCKVGPGVEHGDRRLGYNRTGASSISLLLESAEVRATLQMAAAIVG